MVFLDFEISMNSDEEVTVSWNLESKFFRDVK